MLPLTFSNGAQVVKGGDVVLAIERLKTDRNDKPFDDVKILNMEVKASVD